MLPNQFCDGSRFSSSRRSLDNGEIRRPAMLLLLLSSAVDFIYLAIKDMLAYFLFFQSY